MKKSIFILILISLFFNSSYGQIVLDDHGKKPFKNLHESVTLVTDRSLYISGETLWFSGTVIIAGYGKSDLSKVIYLELFGSDLKTFVKKKFKVDHGFIQGSLEIPEETLSGVYYLRAYTQFNKNDNPINQFYMAITVINPERPLTNPELHPECQKISIDSIGQLENFDFEDFVTFSGLKKEYATRELVKFQVSPQPQDSAQFSHFSVSVFKKGTNFKKNMNNWENNTEAKKEIKESMFWLPEIRDVSLSGMIKDKNSGIVQPNKTVFLSVIGDQPQFLITQSKENGEFVFALNNLTNTVEVVLNTCPDSSAISEVFVNKDFSAEYPETIMSGLYPDESFHSVLNEMLINQQISKMGKPKDTDEMGTIKSPLFGYPDYSIILNDFIELSNLTEVFKELIPQVAIKKKNGNSYLSLISGETGQSVKCEYVFLDNVLVEDINQVLRIPPSKIDRIDVLNRTQYLGDFYLDGAVLIYTNTLNFAGYAFTNSSVFLEYQAISSLKEFKSIRYETIDQKLSRNPDFRTLLYWNPKISIQDGIATLSFFTSDHCSEYNILFTGFTISGKEIIKSGSFFVKDTQ